MSSPDFDGRDDPTQILPEEGVLDLETYLEMQSALGDEMRFRVLYALKRIDSEKTDSDDLADLLDVETDRMEARLDELRDAGLVQEWIQKTPEMDDGEVRVYYRASALAEGLLEEGIEQLLDFEWESLERYS